MDGWTPPTEEEELRLKKQRERNNKISKLMGNYLLKGYKMLGTTCNKCQAILLRDRQGEDFCVGCVEVDGCTSFPPDPPSQINSSKSPSTNAIPISQQQEKATIMDSSSSANRNFSSNNARLRTNGKVIDDQTLECIYQQVSWANKCLSLTDINLEQRSHLVNFIKTCYDTINTITMKNR